MSEQSQAIESNLQEHRLFPPTEAFARHAWIKSREEYHRLYLESISNPDDFWNRIASELHWFTRWNKTLEWNRPYAKWFVGGTTNLSYNCLDHQIELGRGDKTAILWEGEPLAGGQPQVRRLTYRQLHADVCRFANVLKSLGVKKGDRVTIYMPMTPEAAVAMLACARLGAAHSVIFGGFSSQAIVDRVEDAQSTILITADGGHRRGNIVPLKHNVDEALKKTSLVRHVVVLKCTGHDIEMTPGRDHWWHELMARESTDCPAEPMDSEDRAAAARASAAFHSAPAVVTLRSAS